MKTYRHTSFLVYAFLLIPFVNFAQAPNLGTAESFAVFTAVGAFNNDGTTVITGDIGTNVGAFNGFPPGIVIGTIHVADPESAQAAADVALAYSYLDGLTCASVLSATLGNGQILAPNIYCINTAAVLNGELILDGQGDPNARFIFQIDGAFSTATFASITLVNHASLCNVYWQINGAFDLGEGSDFKGTIVANGAISLLEGSSLEGRALTQAGAIDLHNNLISLGVAPVPAIITADGAITFCEGDSVVLSGNIDGIWSNGESGFSITVFASGDYFVSNTNDCGPAVSNHIIVTVTPDITPPIITCPIDFTVECTESILPINTGFAVAVDVCDISPEITYTDMSVPGACIDNYEIIRTWVATDNLGNESFCNQTITIADLSAPVITCPADINLSCTDPITPDATGFATATDNCDGSPTIDYSDVTTPGACPDSYMIIRTWMASDNCGNVTVCDQNLLIIDDSAPTISCPADIAILCTESILPATTGIATAIDNCDALPVIDYTDVQSPSGQCPQNYTIIRTWTATDACGNVSNCIQDIVVTDATDPIISCPIDVTIECDASIVPAITGFASATDDCDLNPLVDYSDNSIPGTCPEILIVIRTWTATDACGNISVCLQNILLIDNESPIITCPQDVSVQCTSEVPAVSIGDVIASDNCDIPIITSLGDQIINQSCPDRYTLLRTYQAEDICGNIASCVQTIYVFDNVAPTISCPVDVTVQCDMPVPAVDISLVIVSDNCGSLVTASHVGDVITNGICINQFEISRTFEAIDDCGNINQCTQIITVIDDIAPILTCPSDLTVTCAEEVPVVDITLVSATDNCDALVDISFLGDIISNQTCDNQFLLTRTFSAMDDCGNLNSCAQLILVDDNILPIISCPPSVTLSCTDIITPALTGVATATDNCVQVPVLDFSDVLTPSILCVQNYSILRTWTALDVCGNMSTCDQLIIVADTTNPVITCPIDVTLECDASILPTITGFASATDDCDLNPLVDFSDNSVAGTCPVIMVVIRTWTATDACGNSIACLQNILLIDDESPVITCPQDVSVQCTTDIPVVSIASVIASDNCGIPVITFIGDDIINQTCLERYTVLRTYQAEDICGNIASCVQTIFVFDNIAPTIVCPVDITVECETQVPAVDVSIIVAPDNCGLQATVTHEGDVISNLVCVNQFVSIRTYQAIDDCGNLNNCTQSITVFDGVAPLITCPADYTVECASEVLPVDLTAILTSDNCLAPVEVTLAGELISNVVCDNNFILTRTFQAMDDCGNLNTCAQIIIVLDDVAPIITCPVTASVECADQVLPEDISLITVTDNCGNAVITFEGEVITNQTCENGFILTRTYRATDVCGNSSTCIQLITVLDTVPPVILFIDPRLVGAEAGDTIEVQCYGQDPQWDIPVFTTGSINASDICAGEVQVDYNKILLDEGDCTTEGFIRLYQLEWTATDICGNSQSVSLFLKLVDTIPPVIIGIPDDVTLDCDALLQQPVNITALDECLCACVIVSEQSDPQPGCQNGMVITITWTAKDQCGNVTNESQNITLVDTVGPTITVIHPDIAGIENGSILEVECNEDGFPRFVQELDIESVYSPDICGGSVVTVLDTSITVSSDCKTTGFIEERTFLWTVTDLCGNSSTFTFSVRLIDTIPPVWLGVPDTVCIGSGLLSGIEATDNCNYPYTRFTDFPIANPCGEGTATKRRYKATDECGNTAEAIAIIIPIEQSIPVILFNNPDLLEMSPGESVIAACASQNGQYTSYGPDDVYIEGVCTEGAEITFTEELIEARDCSVDSIRAIVALIWTVTDICGNSASRSIIATVVDDTPPVFQNFIPEQAIGCTDSMPFNLAIDNCGEVFYSSEDVIIPTSCIYEYDVLRLITATDECGNATTQEQMIHVGSGSGPILSGIEENICDDLTIPLVTAYDPCTAESLDVIMTQDTLDIQCVDGLVIIRTWSAVDTCGRETVVTQTIVVNDHTPPVITIPGNSVLYPFWTKQKSSIYLWQFEAMKKLFALNPNSVVIADDCDQYIVPVFTQISLFSEDCEADGYYERRIYTWIATDICDNADTITVTVDIIDDIPPVFQDFPYDITLYCEPLPPVPELTADDYSNSVSIVFTETITPGVEPGVTIVTRTWVATDVCGNTTKEEQTITWIPDNNLVCEIILPEVVECNSHEVLIHSIVTGDDGIKSYVWKVVGEKCFIQGGQGTPWVKIYVGWGPVKIILTVTDSSGCVSICTTTLECVSASIGGNAIDPSTGSGNKPDPGQLIQPTLIDGADISDIKLWPNPAHEGVHLSFLATDESALTVNILNLLGQTVFTEKVIVQVGYNTRRIDWSHILDGNYIVQVVTNQHVHTRHLAIVAR